MQAPHFKPVNIAEDMLKHAMKLFDFGSPTTANPTEQIKIVIGLLLFRLILIKRAKVIVTFLAIALCKNGNKIFL